ncbi:hypothetical protein AUK40_01005 [Candidatus Wirthbacteria bacterium CG2_30_54_11]|uniref:Mechanosensitive ion channel protein MscS n=1 Tax=Candidatus Wirthbacteria bacterium CG2_30_54_11 TaxID=1817892 RepID=A0A1J5IX11_9BACT|nr:MAG: hypothetical protein AUK40_01005 [Candidatus Wirthbacteria bacterium CG2_30_54_11]
MFSFDQLVNNTADWLRTTGEGAGRWILLGIIISFILRSVVRPRFFQLRKSKDLLEVKEQGKRANTISAVIRGTGNLILWLIIFFLVLKEIGMGISSIVAGVSIVGIAIGLGAQSLVKDMIAGFFIIFENHFNIGDVVRIVNVSGRVEEINLRTTILRDLDGAVHIIPNGQITVVTNKTKQWAQVVLDTPIALSEDIDQAMQVIQKVGEDLMTNKLFQSALLSPPKMLGVHEVSKTQVTIRSLVKTLPEKRWSVERVMRKKIKQAFDKAGIKTVMDI